MERVQISVLKSQLSRRLRAAEAGQAFEIVDRARPIARVVPISATEALETIPARRSFAQVRRVRLPPVKLRTPSTEVLAEERGAR